MIIKFKTTSLTCWKLVGYEDYLLILMYLNWVQLSGSILTWVFGRFKLCFSDSVNIFTYQNNDYFLISEKS